MFPLAPQPELVRASQKDAETLLSLRDEFQDLANLTIGQRASRYSSEIDLACATSYFWFSTGFGAIPEVLMQSTCKKLKHARNSALSTSLDVIENPQLRQVIQNIQHEVIRDAYLSNNSLVSNADEPTSSLSSSQHSIFSYARSLGEEYCSLIPVRRKILGVKSSSNFADIQSYQQSPPQLSLPTPAIILSPDMFNSSLLHSNSSEDSSTLTSSLDYVPLTNTVSLPPQPSLVPLTSKDKLRLYVFDILLPYVIHKTSLMRVVDLSPPPPLPFILTQSPWGRSQSSTSESCDMDTTSTVGDLSAVEKQRQMRLRHQLQMQRRAAEMAAVEVEVEEEMEVRAKEDEIHENINTTTLLSASNTTNSNAVPTHLHSELDNAISPEFEDSKPAVPPHRSFASRV